jgi:glutathione S-transferase
MTLFVILIAALSISVCYGQESVVIDSSVNENFNNTIYTLTYFNSPGRAEFIRLILEYGKVPYKNFFVQRADWQTLKPTTRFGQLPVLRNPTTGWELAQSIAIARFVAKKANLYPKDDIEAAESDQWVDAAQDVRIAFSATLRASPEEKEKIIEQVKQNQLKNYLTAAEKHLTKTGYLVGNSLTWSDFALFNVLDFLPVDLSEYPKVQHIINEIGNSNVIKEYRNSDRYPLNNQ